MLLSDSAVLLPSIYVPQVLCSKLRFSGACNRDLLSFFHLQKKKREYYFQIAHFPPNFNPYLRVYAIRDHFHIRSGTA